MLLIFVPLKPPKRYLERTLHNTIKTLLNEKNVKKHAKKRMKTGERYVRGKEVSSHLLRDVTEGRGLKSDIFIVTYNY